MTTEEELLAETETLIRSLHALQRWVWDNDPGLLVAGGERVWDGIVEGRRCVEAALRYKGRLLGIEEEVIAMIDPIDE